MAKTTFGNGVIVTPQWLNGAKRIAFDGQDLDWHYDPLGLNSLILRGPNGLDSRYVTLGTDQPSLSTNGVFVSGYPVSGNKVATGQWSFGYNITQNPTIPQAVDKAPLSYLTNIQYNYANNTPSPTIPQKFSALNDNHLITKKVLFDQFDALVIDNGLY